MTLVMLGECTQAFGNCGPLMAPEFAAKFVDDVQQIVQHRLTTMSNLEIKELDKDSLQRVLQQFRMFLQIALPDNKISELIEKINLSFAVRFLNTNYLEKRLQGVGEVRNIIERVEAKSILER